MLNCAFVNICKGFNFAILEELFYMFDYGFHQLRLKVQIRKFKSFVICTAYRTDDVPLPCFENDLLFSVNSAMSLNIPVFILADVNILQHALTRCKGGKSAT